MNDKLARFLNDSYDVIKKMFLFFVLLIVLTFASEKLFSLSDWTILVSGRYGYSIHGVSPIVAIAIFITGWLVKKRVQRTEHLKSKFIAVAAHRLRTPLSRIQWGLDDLHQGQSDQEVRDKIDLIKDTTKDTIGLVNNLLDATEAEVTSVYYDYIFERGNIEYIVRQVISDYSVGIKKKNIQLSVSIEDNLPDIRMDKDRIRVVIEAIVENAIMYTPTNGTVNITVYRKGKHVVFSSKDTGIGIDKKSLSNVFSKFFRAKEAVAVSTDRVGLALFTAKEILKRHNGNINAESEGLTRGSHFWFSLPID